MNITNHMKAILRALLIVSLAMSYIVPAAAQEYIGSPVTISKEKVRVNGKLCYSHIVKDKQTLYSIAKAYEVSVDDIYSLNPSLKETGLKKNAIILIPIHEAVAKKDVPLTDGPAEEQPELEVKPAPKAEVAKVLPEPKKKSRTHTAKWYEDIYAIAGKYGVSAEEIMAVNGMTSPKLTKRQKLIIPEPGEVIESGDLLGNLDKEGTGNEENTAEAADTIAKAAEGPVPEWIFRPKHEVTATLILPLKASTENVSRNNMDFYSGVLLAVHDMEEKGVKTILNVYDSTDESHPVSSEDLMSSDMVIGPVSSADLGMLLNSEVSPKMVISPLDPKAESHALTNKGFLQAPTPQRAQFEDLMNWIKEDRMEGDTLVLISEKGARQTEAVMQIRQAVDSSKLDFLTFSYSILEGRDVIEPLTALMAKEGTSRVVIASDSEAFVNDVVRNLNILVYNKLNVVLYAPARIRNFETIEVENLHNTSAHISLGYHIDYENPGIKDFLLKYRALYNTEPTQYAYQGYDIATYFIGLCNKYGNLWTSRISGTEQEMLQSLFKFKEIENGGFVNDGIRRIVYGKGWSVTTVK